MSIGSDYANNATQTLLELGRAQAAAKVQSGQAYGQALGQIGQAVSAIPQQMQAQKTAAIQNAATQAQIADIQAQQAERVNALKRSQGYAQALANATGKYTTQKADGTLDSNDDALAADLTAQGYGPEAQKLLTDKTALRQKFSEMLAATDTHLANQKKLEDQQKDDIANIVDGLKTPTDALNGLHSAVIAGALPADQALKLSQQITSHPDAWPQLQQSLLAASPSRQAEAKAQRESMLKPVPLAAGGSLVVPGTGQVIAGGGSTTEQDDQRYRTIQAAIAQRQSVSPADAAWSSAYEKQKTLGPQATAAAAADRQAATQAQQNDLLGKNQNFQIAQAGRKELSDKIEQPAQTAITSAQTLRDTVKAAQSGNKVAANIQNLEATMATIRAQGLNRINSTELASGASSGDLWDRVQNGVGKLVAGQPVDADLQKDMLKFADVLENAARQKYAQGFTSTKKRYGLDEDMNPDLAPTKSGSSAGPTTRDEVQNGVTYTVTRDASGKVIGAVKKGG